MIGGNVGGWAECAGLGQGSLTATTTTRTPAKRGTLPKTQPIPSCTTTSSQHAPRPSAPIRIGNGFGTMARCDHTPTPAHGWRHAFSRSHAKIDIGRPRLPPMCDMLADMLVNVVPPRVHVVLLVRKRADVLGIRQARGRVCVVPLYRPATYTPAASSLKSCDDGTFWRSA